MSVDVTDLEIRQVQEQEARVLYASGELSITTAEQLRAALLENLQADTVTILNLAAIQRIDLPGLQLLCSAHRTSLQRGLLLEVRAISENVLIAARSAGYQASQSVCPFRRGENCLWRASEVR